MPSVVVGPSFDLALIDEFYGRGFVRVRRLGQPRLRSMMVLDDRVPRLELFCHSQSVDNVLGAIAHRLLTVDYGEGPQARVVQTHEHFYDDDMVEFRDAVVTYARRRRSAPWSLEQAVESYRGPRRARYAKAADALRERPVMKRDAEINMFVKFEKNGAKKGKAPVARIIAPRSYRYIVKLATYLKPIEKLIVQGINKLAGYRAVAKGLNTHQRAAVIEANMDAVPDCVVIGGDAVKLDAHLRKPALIYEHSFYKQIYNFDRTLVRLLNWQLDARAVAYAPDGRVGLRCWDTRGSGDINTGLGNTILVCNMIYAYLKTVPGKTRYFCDGDDFLLFVERRALSTVMETMHAHFLKYGLFVKAEDPVDVIEHVEFCRSHPVWNGTRYTMVRNFPDCLSKDTVATKYVGNVGSFDRARSAISSCSQALNAGIPILSEHAKWLGRGSTKAAIDGDWREWQVGGWHAAPKVADRDHVTPRARVSFWEAFEVPPWAQREYERWFAHDQGPRYGPPSSAWAAKKPFRYGVCRVESSKSGDLGEAPEPSVPATRRF